MIKIVILSLTKRLNTLFPCNNIKSWCRPKKRKFCNFPKFCVKRKSCLHLCLPRKLQQIFLRKSAKFWRENRQIWRRPSINAILIYRIITKFKTYVSDNFFILIFIYKKLFFKDEGGGGGNPPTGFLEKLKKSHAGNFLTFSCGCRCGTVFSQFFLPISQHFWDIRIQE